MPQYFSGSRLESYETMNSWRIPRYRCLCRHLSIASLRFNFLNLLALRFWPFRQSVLEVSLRSWTTFVTSTNSPLLLLMFPLSKRWEVFFDAAFKTVELLLIFTPLRNAATDWPTTTVTSSSKLTKQGLLATCIAGVDRVGPTSLEPTHLPMCHRSLWEIRGPFLVGRSGQSEHHSRYVGHL